MNSDHCIIPISIDQRRSALYVRCHRDNVGTAHKEILRLKKLAEEDTGDTGLNWLTLIMQHDTLELMEPGIPGAITA